MDDNRDITELKGIGEKTAVLFHKIGVFSFADLLYYFPRDYVRYEDLEEVTEQTLNRIIAFEAYFEKRPLMRRSGRLTITTCRLVVCRRQAGEEDREESDNTSVQAVWFNMPYLAKSFPERGPYVFYGQVYRKANRLCIDQPAVFTKEQFEELRHSLQPVYGLTKGLSNNTVKKSVRQLLSQGGGSGCSSDRIISLHDDGYDFRTMHFPKTIEELKQARERFVYDEFFMYILRLRFLREENEQARNDFSLIDSAYCTRIIEGLPYRLTNAQEKVWEEISSDLKRERSMNRLVQGDVGSGKTILAFLAAVMVAANGLQSAIMAPTEILAAQHFETLSALLAKHGIPIRPVLLTGSTPGSARREICQAIGDGSAGIVIGTHALFQEKVKYHRLALVVTDEQHRFGVRQREALIGKNSVTPHVMVMSATPIPRTLAIILYGDLDISVIDEVPARRLPVKNCVVNESWHENAYRFMEKEIAAGHQCYVICPLVEAADGEQMLKDAQGYTEILRNRFGDTIQIGCLHGKMKPAAKAKVMEEFYQNHLQILVSTTVVEVGVNVPNATVMVIENAERFGLAQLHQLRGRIGRGDAQSYCIFITGNDNEENKERLDILVHHNDGFEIARKDLELRGPGELFGVRQSGALQFKLGDVLTDAATLKQAAEDVAALLKKDPGLVLPENALLRGKLDRFMLREQSHTI
ncbi:MAG: ATP-dependent DNA helicase RecG [Lachnospiraceae bacterium]|nr:ATP-dependent DNA helicase RecG [Lachnospiraceae bacterium]